MAGRINDVDPGAFPFNRRTLGKDGDPALAFDVVAVHRPFGDGFVVAVDAGLLEQFVNKCCLAVVNVRDDRDIADIHNYSLSSGGQCHRARI